MTAWVFDRVLESAGLKRTPRKPLLDPKLLAETIRRLELDLGFREWDDNDERAFVSRFKDNLYSQVRYIHTDGMAEQVATALAAERAKYVKADA